MSSSSRSGKGKERQSEEANTSSVLSHTMDQLISNGFMSKPLDTFTLDAREAVRLERCLATMLTRLSSSQQDLARLMDKHRSLASDYDRLEQGQSRSKRVLEASEHEKEQAKAKAVAATKELTAEQAKHAIAKDEIQKARLALTSVKTMALHESKRRENEVASVLARWQKVSSTSSSLQLASTIVVNGQEKIGKNDMLTRSRGDGRETPSGMTLLEESLRRADEEKHVMQEENIHLREVMGDIMTEIRATLSSINVEMPPLQEELNDPFVQLTSPHLTLSPNELLDYLSKLLVTLRDATHSAIQASEETVSKALSHVNEETSTKIAELEASLIAMQTELDTARSGASHATRQLDDLQAEIDEQQIGLVKALQLAKAEKAKAKAIQEELSVLEKSNEKLVERYEEEREARKKDQETLKTLRYELESLKRAGQQSHASESPTKKKRPASAMDESLGATSEVRPAKRESRSARQSSTSAALRHILATSADTPRTKSVPLTSKLVNSQPVAPSKETTEKEEAAKRSSRKHAELDGKTSLEEAPPNSAALAAKDRIHRAVEAAKARNGSGSRSDGVSQRRK